ncbi:MAG: NUDIX hydrolase [Anaerolineae bacterium]|nr:NUDIX hydrolase [Anaerolineae bacterium]
MIADQAYLASLPTKRMGAGCLLRDEYGRVLLVKPNYKPVWEIPGGVVEHNESPKQCCWRELREELGLEREVGRLLVVDYNHSTEAKSESLMFIFDGGTLSPTEITSIQVCPDELDSFSFFTPENLPAAMTHSLKERVLVAWQNLSKLHDVYWENRAKGSHMA